MILHLTDKLVKKRQYHQNFNDLLFNLMIGYKEGKHIIVISPLSLQLLIADQTIGDETKKYLIHYNSHNKSSVSSLAYFNVIIKLIPDSKEEKFYCKHKCKTEIRKIHLSKVLDSINIQHTVLLGENANDSKAFAMIADYYKYKSSLRSFNLYFRPQTGGGDTTAKQYANIYETGEEFCLCILDSDTRYPAKGYGSTPKKVKQYHQAQYQNVMNLKCQYFILNSLEIENIFPKEFYIAAYENVDVNKKGIYSKLEKLINIDEKAIDYFDFKHGIKCFYDQKDEGLNHFWHGILSEANVKCEYSSGSLKYVKGYGDKILEDFIEYDIDDIYDFVESNQNLHEKWISLGKSISSFIMGTSKVRAI